MAVVAFEQVWAVEGGVTVRFERHGPGTVRVVIDTGGAGKISATVEEYRWRRLVAAMAVPEEPINAN